MDQTKRYRMLKIGIRVKFERTRTDSDRRSIIDHSQLSGPWIFAQLLFYINLDLLLPRHGHRSVAVASTSSQPIKSPKIYHIGGAHMGLDQNYPQMMPYELWEFNGDNLQNSTLSKNGLDRFYYWPESFLQIQ